LSGLSARMVMWEKLVESLLRVCSERHWAGS